MSKKETYTKELMMDQENVINALIKVKRVCSYGGCKECVFFDDGDGCSFYTRPYDWNLSAFDK